MLVVKYETGTIGMPKSTRSGDWNVVTIFTRQDHITSRSKSTTANCIARTNLSKMPRNTRSRGDGRGH